MNSLIASAGAVPRRALKIPVRNVPGYYPVMALASINVNISSAPSSIDGVTLSVNDRVLLSAQTTGAENGIRIFTAASAPLLRASDMDMSSDVILNSLVGVIAGTINGGKYFRIANIVAVTIGSTTISFQETAVASGVELAYSADTGSRTFTRVSGNTGNVVTTVGELPVVVTDRPVVIEAYNGLVEASVNTHAWFAIHRSATSGFTPNDTSIVRFGFNAFATVLLDSMSARYREVEAGTWYYKLSINSGIASSTLTLGDTSTPTEFFAIQQ